MSTVDELLTVLDPIRLDRVLSAIESIGPASSRTADEVLKSADKVDGAAKKQMEETKKRLKDAEDRWGHLGRAVEAQHLKMEQEGTFRITLWSKNMEKALDRAEARWKQYGNEVKRQMGQARGGIGKAGGAMGLSGSRGAVNAIGTQVRALAQALPMGGLLGLALYGAVKESEWAAAGNRISRQFAGVGRIGTETVKKMRNWFVRTRTSLIATEADLAAMTAAYAEFGFTGAEALQKSAIHTKDFGDTVFDTAFAFDAMTKSAAGTHGKLVAQSAQISGEFDKSAQAIFKFGFALRDTGANYQHVMSGMMQAMSTLRMQRQGVADLTEQYVLLREGMSKGLYGTNFQNLRDAQKQQISAMATTGVGAAAQAVGAMPEGMAVVLAQRLAKGGGKQMSGLELLGRFREGKIVGAEGQMLGQTLLEAGKLVREIAPGVAKRAAGGDVGARYELIEIAKKMPGFGNQEAARALIDISQAIMDDVDASGSIEAAVEKNKDELSKAMEAIRSETSPFQRFQKQIFMAMAKVGKGVLQILAHALPILVDGVLSIPAVMTDMGNALIPWGDPLVKGKIFEDAQERLKSGKMVKAAEEQQKGMEEIWDGLKDVLKTVETAGKTVAGGGGAGYPGAKPKKAGTQTLEEQLSPAARKILGGPGGNKNEFAGLTLPVSEGVELVVTGKIVKKLSGKSVPSLV
jgi:hypothetical protein